MKKKKNYFTNVVKQIAEKALKRDANRVTCAAIFQPKAPLELKMYSKIKND